MSKEEFNYTYNNITYRIEITYRGCHQKNIYFRKNGNTFLVTASSIASRAQIMKALPNAIEKLNARTSKRQSKEFITNEGVYLLGEYQRFNNDHFDFMGQTYLYLNKELFYKPVFGI